MKAGMAAISVFHPGLFCAMVEAHLWDIGIWPIDVLMAMAVIANRDPFFFQIHFC